MKSTKALQIDGVGCLVQVSTESAGKGVAEALVFIPEVILDSTDVPGIYRLASNALQKKDA